MVGGADCIIGDTTSEVGRATKVAKLTDCAARKANCSADAAEAVY